MPKNVFDVFMSAHPPVGDLIPRANSVLWDQSALDPVLKERLRIALAEAIGCSYCARFRTELDDGPVLESHSALAGDGLARAELLDRLAEESVKFSDGPPDALVAKVQERFTEAEFTDIIFSLGWFIGMQHVGRLMHWDESCPVAPIREMVESGEAA